MANSTLQTIAGVAGNILEWYDFTLFGFFSDIIAQVFFPPSTTHGNLVKSFALFGGAFLMRPIGGMITGHVGDKHGRKQALVMSLFLMAVPTFVMGCLPTYEQVGGWSTALLIICRLSQGMSVGGQLPASLIYTVETKPKEHWGYYGALVGMAGNFGCLLGSFVAALLRTLLTDDQLLAWGWRIPFLSGILIAFCAMYLKIHGEEHHPNAGEYDEGSHQEGSDAVVETKHPFKEVFTKENIPALLSSSLTPMLYLGGFYLTFVWMSIFMDSLIDPPIKNAFWINAMAMLFGNTFILLLGGWLSDRYGRVKIMTVGVIGTGVLGPFMVYVISLGKPVEAFFAQSTIGIFLGLYAGPLHAWLVESFPTKIRLSSVSFGYNLASCTAGAFSPLVATVLVHNVGPVSPGAMYPFFALLALVGISVAMYVSPKSHNDGKLRAENGEKPSMDGDLGDPLL